MRTVPDMRRDEVGYQPAVEPAQITVGAVFRKLANLGDSDFITAFSHRYSTLSEEVDLSEERGYEYGDSVLIASIPVHTPRMDKDKE